MSKKIDLTGQKFGHWTVLKYDKNSKWICQCDCGTIKSVNTISLRKGTSTSCGCEKAKKARENNGKFINEIGNHYGRLTVIAKDEELSIKKHRAYWICQCECGNIKIVSSKLLRNGHTNSCGCILSKGEMKIQQILSKEHIRFQAQYVIQTGDQYHHYRYDFALLDATQQPVCFIEYNGIQHYQYLENPGNSWNTEEEFELTQERDKKKQELAQSYNIPLYIIPYWEYDNLKDNLMKIILPYYKIIKDEATAPDLEEAQEITEEDNNE